MALRYFAEQHCDLVIWETGLGGRLDATNIVTPIASVITNIQYDHQKWLGDPLASIAFEKAGIIKPGVPVVTGSEAPEALEVITARAREQIAPLTIVSADQASQPPLDAIRLPLVGRHQRMNAAVAIATVRELAASLPLSEEMIFTGLERVHWSGRLQLVELPTRQKILLDGAHNIGGAEMLAAAIREYFSNSDTAGRASEDTQPKPALVLGILRDKDWAAMCRTLAPLAGRILLVPVHSERTAEPHGLAEVCHLANPGAQVSECPTLRAALEAAAKDNFVIIAGSLYLIGEAMELLGLSPTLANSERRLNEWSVPGLKL
jgi:dihydrofolate synthase / folylpolyglutamate synthase